MDAITTYHLVRYEDLNHHDTLFAGRIAEWIIEAGFLSAAAYLQTKHIVCANVHELRFLKPVHCGEAVQAHAAVVHTGRSSVMVHVELKAETCCAAECFITFVNVDDQGKAKPHGCTFQPATAEEEMLEKSAKELLKK